MTDGLPCVGSPRALQDEGIDLLLLWKQGEPVALARQRLAAITVDPTAGRAPRDHVLPAYETVADLLPRPVRIDLHHWSTEGRATTTGVEALLFRCCYPFTARCHGPRCLAPSGEIAS
ncbi:hypothetical protein [Streptomyces sp. NPDC050255]|uniref:hypothetical protein n=1 Tax=Streptomyces sp. NPDC050255 TaxID=3365606 RepID=UPI003795BA33